VILLLALPAPAVARILAYLLWLPLRWCISVVGWVDAIPWADAALPQLPVWGGWLIYALLLLLAWSLPARGAEVETEPRTEWRRVLLLSGAMAVVALLWLAVASLPDGRLHVYTLDVGQGDAILLRTARGQVVLIDGGPDPVLLASRLGETLPFWEREIDLLLVTHDDTDHIGGLAPLASRYRIGQVLLAGPLGSNPASVALRDALRDSGIPQSTLSAGALIRLAGSQLSVLHPATPLGHNDAQDNDRSLVLVLEHGEFRMLLMGDAGEAVERRLLAAGGQVATSALKVSHHGAQTATGGEFLEAVSPQVALVSVGADNRYGHPSSAVIQRLEQADALILRTDELGTIELSTDGARMWVETER
jgi:competence protein ComEC